MDKIEIGVDVRRVTFHCKKGHSWEGHKDDSNFTFFSPCDDSYVNVRVLVKSGPLCPYCFCADLKDRYGAVEPGAVAEDVS